MTALELVLSRFPDAKKTGDNQWAARCPAHNDKSPSLSISEGDNGLPVLYCHAGCPVEEVVAARGLTMADLMGGNGDGRRRLPRSAASKAPKPKAPPKPKPPLEVFPTREAAALSYGLGEPSGVWPYETSQGDEVGATVRWDTSKGKVTLPVALVADGWACCAMPEPRPLYNLPVVRETDGAVWVLEGEKCCEAARDLGLTSTTSAGGARAAAKTDWSPLAGRSVVLLPDHDKAGEDYALEVVKLLSELNPPATVRILRLPDLPDKGDVVQFIEARPGVAPEAIRAELEALAAAVPVVEVEATAEAAPAHEPPAEWVPFPTEHLPPVLRAFVTETADAIGCDVSLVALPALAVVASAIGTTRQVYLKRTWQEYPIVWAGAVVRSGGMKSPAFNAALAPMYHAQGEAMRRHGELVELMANEPNGGKKQKPPEPTTYVTSDVTIEALAGILQSNPRGCLVARDELSGLVQSFNAYKARGRGGDEARWLEVSQGGVLSVDRKGDGKTWVKGAAASICGTIQPGIAARVFSGPHTDNGLLARLLVASPPSRRKRWSERTPGPAVVEDYHNLVARLLTLEHGAGDYGPRPVVLKLTPEAKALWVPWYDLHAGKIYEAETDKEAACLSKCEAYGARLSLVYALAENPDALEVGPEAVRAGTALADWFGAEALRTYAVMAQTDEAADADRLADLVARRGGDISPRELTQVSRDYGTTTEAEAALAALVAVGRGRWVWPPAGPAGGRPGKRFVLSTKPPENRPPVYDTPADGPENAGSVDCRRVDNENAEPPTSPWAGMVELDGDGLTAVERAARYRAEVAHEA